MSAGRWKQRAIALGSVVVLGILFRPFGSDAYQACARFFVEFIGVPISALLLLTRLVGGKACLANKVLGRPSSPDDRKWWQS